MLRHHTHELPARHDRPLREQRDPREHLPEKRGELRPGEFLDMERVVVRARIRVERAVRRRDEEHPARAQDAAHLPEERLLDLLRHMLDRLEAHHQVERIIRRGDRVRRPLLEREMRAAIRLRRVVDRLLADIDAEHAPRRAGEQLTPVSLAAREIEHILPCGELRRPTVAGEMLRSNHARDLVGDKPFTCKLHALLLLLP